MQRRPLVLSILAMSLLAVIFAAADSSTRTETAGGAKPGDALANLEPRPLFAKVTGTVPAVDRDPVKHNIRRGTLKVVEPLAQEAILNAEAHVFNLFDDVRVVAFRSRVERRTSRNHSWFGYIPGDEYGRAIVSIVDGTLAVVVTHDARRYMVLPLKDGLYEVLEIDQGSFEEGDDTIPSRPAGKDGGGIPPGGPPSTRPPGLRAVDVESKIQTLSQRFTVFNGDLPRYGPAAEDGSAIDVMVLYTKEAGRFSGFEPIDQARMYLRTQAAIDETNVTFVDSQVTTQLRLVYGPVQLAPEYQEDPVMAVNLSKVRDEDVFVIDPLSNQVKTVHQLRDDWAADIVVLITAGGISDTGGSLCGQASRPTGSADFATLAANAFMVVKNRCFGSGWVFAHELGHLLGTDHDWFTINHQGAGFVSNRGHGFNVILPGPSPLVKRTIMTYNTYCFLPPEQGGLGIPKDQMHNLCRSLWRWSNASQTIDGRPLGGVVDETRPLLLVADEVPVLNTNRIRVSNYRLAACRALSVVC
jgi:hypothetical protein